MSLVPIYLIIEKRLFDNFPKKIQSYPGRFLGSKFD